MGCTIIDSSSDPRIRDYEYARTGRFAAGAFILDAVHVRVGTRSIFTTRCCNSLWSFSEMVLSGLKHILGV